MAKGSNSVKADLRGFARARGGCSKWASPCPDQTGGAHARANDAAVMGVEGGEIVT